MGVIRSDYPLLTITVQRWQKQWISEHRSINFSGLVQEMVTELIKQHDPKYYESNKRFVNGIKYKGDLIKTIMIKHPEIVPSKY